MRGWQPAVRAGEHGHRTGVTGPTPAEPRWPVGRLVVVPGVVPVAAIVIGAVLFLAQGAACARLPTQEPVPPSPLVGVVVRIDQESLGVINEFDVLMPHGKTVTLAMGQLDNALQFSPSHLATHMASGVPIRAFYRLENGLPTVYHLEDAVLPSSPAPTAT